MARLEPVPGERAALATIDGERALLIADYHAGVEAGLRYERGIEVPSRAAERRERLRAAIDRTDADRLVILGDLMHSIGEPGGAERGELEVLFETLAPVAVTLVKGNHDGAIESWLYESIDESGTAGATSLSVSPGEGTLLGEIGVCHGHSWPSADALDGSVLCMGHEHPCVRLEDEVGGSRIEPVWLRGSLDRSWLGSQIPTGSSAERLEYEESTSPDDGGTELVVLPAFNELVGGTWVNVAGQSFLSPMLPRALVDGEAYLVDGTRLGPYDSI
ncbi:metallophosphoesterase [Halovivax gelatinilyticus]|uniref:metallophosphoesterase n=1 Tax=Halovivax gelatinilyticus TaxID=2961597 RepID=UPI0020CA5B33|nr:metallophosphoesterase [Halovivax gelatinilyticus]